MSFLSGCESVNAEKTSALLCPPPVWADEKVEEELATIPFEGYEDLYDWLSAIEKLNEKLEIARD